MSYCVHCGVELDPTASFCPLCHTPVADPRQPVDTDSPKPFPTRRGEVAPVSKVEVGLLITAMLASVAVPLQCGPASQRSEERAGRAHIFCGGRQNKTTA